MTNKQEGRRHFDRRIAKNLLERKDAALAVPICPSCGKEIMRTKAKRVKTFTGRFDTVTLARSFYRCRGCRKTAVPFDEWLRLVGKSLMPVAERMVMSAIFEMGGHRACAMIKELSGVEVSRSLLDREGRRLGKGVVEFERKEVVSVSAAIRRAFLLIVLLPLNAFEHSGA